MANNKNRQAIFTAHCHAFHLLEVAVFQAYVRNPGNLNMTYTRHPKNRSETATHENANKEEFHSHKYARVIISQAWLIIPNLRYRL